MEKFGELLFGLMTGITEKQEPEERSITDIYSCKKKDEPIYKLQINFVYKTEIWSVSNLSRTLSFSEQIFLCFTSF